MSSELVERFIRGVQVHLNGGTPSMPLPGYYDDWNARRDLRAWFNQHMGGLGSLSEAERATCRGAIVEVLHRRDERAFELFEVVHRLLLPEECLAVLLSAEAREYPEDLSGLAWAVQHAAEAGVLTWAESWRPVVLDGARRQRVWLYLEAFRHDRAWFVEHIGLLFGEDAELAGRRMVHTRVRATTEEKQALWTVVQAASEQLDDDVIQAILDVLRPTLAARPNSVDETGDDVT